MMVCLSIASRLYGFNLHIWDIPFDKIPTSNVYTLLFEVTFSISSSCTKLSLLWFCRRIRGDGRKINCTFHDVAIVVTMMVIAVFESAFLIMLFLQCRYVGSMLISQSCSARSHRVTWTSPLKALFDLEPTYPYACNINSHLLSFAASVANTITDFFTTLIPITIVAKLHLPTRQRIAIMTIFALGATVNIAGALRTYYDHQSMIVTNLDRSWVGWPTCVCGVVEIGLGVVRYFPFFLFMSISLEILCNGLVMLMTERKDRYLCPCFAPISAPFHALPSRIKEEISLRW